MLTVRNAPQHAAMNFWMLSLRQTALAYRCRILLIGAHGNAGISWADNIFQSIGLQLHGLGWRTWSKEAAKRYAPVRLLNVCRNIRKAKGWSGGNHPPYTGIRQPPQPI